MTESPSQNIRERRFDTSEALVDDLRRRIADTLTQAVREVGAASLVVSGGSTPGPLFDALSQTPLPWEHVHVTLADERWVPPDHEASNERLVKAAPAAEPGRQGQDGTSLVTSDATPEEGAAVIEERLGRIPRPLDVVILGMGTDGHTASLFPQAPELTAGLDPETSRACLAVRPPGAAHPRLSLTARALKNSRWRILHLRGDAKWQVYRQAAEPGPVADMPDSRFAASRTRRLLVAVVVCGEPTS